jgi:hypothetical protein
MSRLELSEGRLHQTLGFDPITLICSANSLTPVCLSVFSVRPSVCPPSLSLSLSVPLSLSLCLSVCLSVCPLLPLLQTSHWSRTQNPDRADGFPRPSCSSHVVPWVRVPSCVVRGVNKEPIDCSACRCCCSVGAGLRGLREAERSRHGRVPVFDSAGRPTVKTIAQLDPE